jgi:hypothetical protein
MGQPLDCKRETITRSTPLDTDRSFPTDFAYRRRREANRRGSWCAFDLGVSRSNGSQPLPCRDCGCRRPRGSGLISLWLYAYGRGISSARELSRQCEFEPGSMWLCGCQPISYRTLSGFRSDYQVALDDLFVQVLGMLSAEYICPRDAGQTKLPHVIKTPAGDSGDRSFGGYFVFLASPV